MIKPKSIFYLGSSAILFLLYYYCHSKIPISSDSVTMIPVARDLLRGNLFLNDWIVGSNNFLFTETIFYVPGLALSISAFNLEAILSSLAFALLVAFNCYFFLADKNITYTLAYIVVVGVVSHQTAYTLLNSNSHNAAYFFILLEISLLYKYEKKHDWRMLILYILIGALTQYSDGVFLMELIAPVLGYCLYKIIKNKAEKDTVRRYLYVFISTILIYVLSKIIVGFYSLVDGLVTRGLPIGLISFRDIPRRICDWKMEFLLIWGYSYNSKLVIAKIYNSVITTLIILFFVAWFHYLLEIIRFRIQSKAFIVWLMVTFNFVGCLFTSVAIVHRYCVPLYIWGTILILMFVEKIICFLNGNLKICIPLASVGTISLLVIVGFRLVEFLNAPVFINAQKEVANFILEKNWGDGYGQFWSGPILGAIADYDYNIYPVYTSGSNFIAYPELIKKEWYEERDIHFTVTYTDDAQNEIVNVRNADIVTFAGEPDELYDIWGYRIMYWDKDISQFME